MKLIIDISKDRYDEIMSMDWKNCRLLFDEEIRAIHDGKVLEQEPMIDWITEENPEYADVYLVTWRHPLWEQTAYIGLCEWDGERWLIEDMEQSKLYKETLIILAWSDPEPYMGWKETK